MSRPQFRSGSLLSNKLTFGRRFVPRAIRCLLMRLQRTDHVPNRAAPVARHSAMLAVLLGVMAAFMFSSASSAQNAGILVPREILALYDAREEPTPDGTRVHHFVEMPLNHLGYIVTYWDVTKGMPDESRLADVRGILAWFVNEQPRELFVWLQHAAARRIRIAVLGDAGFPATEDAQLEANRLFARIGFSFTGSTV